MVRALPLHGRCRGFESLIAYHFSLFYTRRCRVFATKPLSRNFVPRGAFWAVTQRVTKKASIHGADDSLSGVAAPKARLFVARHKMPSLLVESLIAYHFSLFYTRRCRVFATNARVRHTKAPATDAYARVPIPSSRVYSCRSPACRTSTTRQKARKRPKRRGRKTRRGGKSVSLNKEMAPAPGFDEERSDEEPCGAARGTSHQWRSEATAPRGNQPPRIHCRRMDKRNFQLFPKAKRRARGAKTRNWFRGFLRNERTAAEPRGKSASLKNEMAPAPGFEPGTKWLTATYSTIELCRSVYFI